MCTNVQQTMSSSYIPLMLYSQYGNETVNIIIGIQANINHSYSPIKCGLLADQVSGLYTERVAGGQQYPVLPTPYNECSFQASHKHFNFPLSLL